MTAREWPKLSPEELAELRESNDARMPLHSPHERHVARVVTGRCDDGPEARDLLGLLGLLPDQIVAPAGDRPQHTAGLVAPLGHDRENRATKAITAQRFAETQARYRA